MNAPRLAAATASMALLVACGGTLSAGGSGGPACDGGGVRCADPFAGNVMKLTPK